LIQGPSIQGLFIEGLSADANIVILLCRVARSFQASQRRIRNPDPPYPCPPGYKLAVIP
jgi:hypothetical protein